MASTYEDGYMALRQAGLHGGNLSSDEKRNLTLVCRSASLIKTAITAQTAQAVTLQALIDAHNVAWAAVLAIGTIVDGTRAAAVTAIDAAIVTSEALQTGWALHIAILAKTKVDTDNAALDTLGALTGADTSADFNTNIGLVVASKALMITAVDLVLDPTQAIAAEFPVAIASLAQTNMDMA